jgi:hypothetical protein
VLQLMKALVFARSPEPKGATPFAAAGRH